MTDQLTAGTPTRTTRRLSRPKGWDRGRRLERQWTQHGPREFPHRIGDHAPNLATLAQLRSGGRNPLLLTGSRRRRAVAPGCTQR
ncbi:MAG: hypothetical protein ABJA74_04805 [Lapillicoccus sp.]